VGIINGSVVQPGEIFDINKILGPRTYALGWKGANGIVDGSRYEIQPGGGVCQVSTTLFGAVLRADLEVVERKHHSFPSTYVKIGQDATISTGGPNFRFKNTRSSPIYVIMKADAHKNITVELYGPPHPKGYTVKITSELVSVFYPGSAITTVDASKPAGYKETVSIYHVGKKSRTYKTYYKDGKQVGEPILIYSDTYPAVRGRYIVGTAKTAAPTTTPTVTAPPATAPPPATAAPPVTAPPPATAPPATAAPT
jgi:vancomycin resistance protein YoaR